MGEPKTVAPLKTGQYLKGNYTLNKIHNSIGVGLGVTLDDFGDASYAKGRIDEMIA